MEANPLYSELRGVLDKMGRKDIPVNKTNLWQYSIDKSGENGIPFFYANPPVSGAEPSKRILVCSTRAEAATLDKILKEKCHNDDIEGMKKEIKSYLNVFHNKHLPGKELDINELLELRKDIKSGDEIQHCVTTGSFWSDFFNNVYFLDEPATIPKKMIATGYLRNYIRGAGESLEVSERLENFSISCK